MEEAGPAVVGFDVSAQLRLQSRLRTRVMNKVWSFVQERDVRQDIEIRRRKSYRPRPAERRDQPQRIALAAEPLGVKGIGEAGGTS